MFGKRKKQERKIGSAFDRLLNYTFKKDEDMNTQLLDLADIVINNRPLPVSYTHLTLPTILRV